MNTGYHRNILPIGKYMERFNYKNVMKMKFFLANLPFVRLWNFKN